MTDHSDRLHAELLEVLMRHAAAWSNDHHLDPSIAIGSMLPVLASMLGYSIAVAGGNNAELASCLLETSLAQVQDAATDPDVRALGRSSRG